MPEASGSQIIFNDPFRLSGLCSFIQGALRGNAGNCSNFDKSKIVSALLRSFNGGMLVDNFAVHGEDDITEANYVCTVSVQFSMAMTQAVIRVFQRDDATVWMEVKEYSPCIPGSMVSGFFYDKLELVELSSIAVVARNRHIVVYR